MSADDASKLSGNLSNAELLFVARTSGFAAPAGGVDGVDDAYVTTLTRRLGGDALSSLTVDQLVCLLKERGLASTKKPKAVVRALSGRGPWRPFALTHPARAAPRRLSSSRASSPRRAARRA